MPLPKKDLLALLARRKAARTVTPRGRKPDPTKNEKGKATLETLSRRRKAREVQVEQQGDSFAELAGMLAGEEQ